MTTFFDILKFKELLVPIGLITASLWGNKKMNDWKYSKIENKCQIYTEKSSPIKWYLVIDDSLNKPTNNQRGGNFIETIVSKAALPATIMAGRYMVDYIKNSGRTKKSIASRTVDSRGFSPMRKISAKGGGINGIFNVNDLILTLGLTFGAKWYYSRITDSNKFKAKKLARLSNNGSKMIGGDMSLPFLNDGFISRYLNAVGIEFLKPSTLIPAGIILLIYMIYKELYGKDKIKKNMNREMEEFSELVDKSSLRKYMDNNGIKTIDLDTPMPFAYLMGRDAFKNVVKK